MLLGASTSMPGDVVSHRSNLRIVSDLGVDRGELEHLGRRSECQVNQNDRDSAIHQIEIQVVYKSFPLSQLKQPVVVGSRIASMSCPSDLV